MDQLLPMSLANLEALIMELMILGMAANSIQKKKMMACIQSRHQMSELTPPILRQIVRQNIQGSRVDNGGDLAAALPYRDAPALTDGRFGRLDVASGMAGGVGCSDRDS
jgi:hypothetical protein